MNLELNNDFSLLKRQILDIFQNDYFELKRSGDYAKRKLDNSWVTEIDHIISNVVVSHFEEKNIWVLSEEAERKELKYPCVIVDPIDGTRELVNEVPEFCVSLAYMNSERFDDPKNVSWIFNPVTGFEIFSEQMIPRHESFYSKDNLRGFVSRNGFNRKISEKYLEHDIYVSPFGSIALKIGMLAIGACDFIYSHREKSVWDIAAGTHMCHLAGIVCLSNGKRLTTLEAIEVEGPLLWVREEHLAKVNEVLCRKDGK